MSNYPTLNSMGVQNPLQISSYTLSQPRMDTDVLRIRYERPKGSFLPVTRSYTFGRMTKGVAGQEAPMHEISPMLSKAIFELDNIVGLRGNQQELKKHILEELERIQIEISAELSALRQLAAKLES